MEVQNSPGAKETRDYSHLVMTERVPAEAAPSKP
jgi:hypothetical protein